MDRVRLFKMEIPPEGVETDPYPTEIDSNEDYADVHGITFQDSDSDDEVVSIVRTDDTYLKHTIADAAGRHILTVDGVDVLDVRKAAFHSNVETYINRDDLRAVVTPGLWLINNTAATAVIPVQFAPAIYIQGQAWGTSPTQSLSYKWRIRQYLASGANPYQYNRLYFDYCNGEWPADWYNACYMDGNGLQAYGVGATGLYLGPMNGCGESWITPGICGGVGAYSSKASLLMTYMTDGAGRTAWKLGSFYAYTQAKMFTIWNIISAVDTELVYFDNNGSVVLTYKGLLYLKETTTPAAKADHGCLYTKSDNDLYFQDGAGNEHEMAKVSDIPAALDPKYANMYLNNNGNTTVIETASTPIGLRQFTTGLVEGWTFDAGSTGAITAYADYSGTVPGAVKVTSAGHTLSTGDIISIRGTTSYNGVFSITKIDDNEFYIIVAWVANDGASDWDEPSHLVAGAGAAGKYQVNWNLNSLIDTTAKPLWIYVYINTTASNGPTSLTYYATQYYPSGGNGIITIAEGDWVFLAMTESGGTQSIINRWGSLTLTRINE